MRALISLSSVTFVFSISFLFIVPLQVLAQNLEGPFSDIHPSSKFSLPLSYLKEQKIIEGYANGTFRPAKKIKRKDALAMILNTVHLIKKEPLAEISTAGIKGPGGRLKRINLAEALRLLFHNTQTDTQSTKSPLPLGISPNDWFTQDIAYAVERYLVTQRENGEIFPAEKNLSRGEMALLLYRFLKTQENVMFGYATWYGDGLAKTKLTKGTEYAKQFLTAAHLTIPFGTIVRVTNMQNGKQVDVVINDRGPFVKGRIIDLSKTAFSALEAPSQGIISVQIEILNQ